MTLFYSNRKALFFSVVALIICIIMLLGATYAWFTDSATSPDNNIETGDLYIVLEYWDGEKWVDAESNVIPFVAADGRAQSEILWEPGCTYKMAPFRVRNEGSLCAKILITINGVSGDAKLLDVIEFKNTINKIPQSVLDGSAGNQLQRFEGATLDFMYGMPEGDIVFDWSLAGKGTTTPGTGHTDTSPEFTITAHMAEEAGNEYMNLTIEGISITVLATQQSYESDSFGNDYDADATYPVVLQNTKVDGSSVTLKNDDMGILIPAGASAGNYAMKVSNQNVTTDADGQTTLSMDITLEKDGVKVEETDGVQYKVSFTIGTGLNVTSVIHNGVAISDFTYSGLTGKVQFYTSSFSPFVITYSKVEGLNPDARYLASAIDIHNSTTTSGIFQLTADVQTSNYGDNARYGYGYEYIIRSQADYTLDLNGKTIIHDTVNENANKNAFTYTLVANHAGTKLTIDGEGVVRSHNSEGYTCAVQGKDGTLITINDGEFNVTNGIAVWAGAGAHIVINGGSFVNSGATTDHELIYTSGGVIDIYGGFFHNTDGNYTLNVEDRNRSTGFINVYGGTYVNFNPATGGQDPNNIKLGEGYTVVEETQENGDVWYTVVPVEK